MSKYYLTEIGFDTSCETEESLIRVAHSHCISYEDRESFLPIDTVEKAINYFENYGFTVEEIKSI